jgi:carboxypeptidase Q
MARNRSIFIGIVFFVLLAIPTVGQIQPDADPSDALAKIRDEGLTRSQVMKITSYLTDTSGPRLTNSPNIKVAAQWVLGKLNEWGVSNPRLETWGPFGRGWSNEKFQAAMVKPYRMSLIGATKAWTPGTSGVISGDVAIAVVTTQADIEKFRGKLSGKFVLAMTPRVVTAQFQPNATRFTDEQLLAMSNPPAPRGGGGGVGGAGGTGARGGGQRGTTPQNLTRAQRNKFYLDEGVLAIVEHGSATGGNITVQDGGDPAVNAAPIPVQIVVAVEHYGIMFRNLENGIPVSMDLDVENRFYDQDLNAFNIVGEIPGTDKASEVVMIGAHFDSWHAGTGATDNAAGCAVMLEAMRILKASGLPTRRTVRIGLWTGEEQGLFGSAAYVREHFAVRQTMQLKPDHEKMSVYFNVDNGTGQIRGVYLQGNTAARPVVEAWMQPFKDFGMTTLTNRGTSGTDHTSFDDVGLPGFQFIQDEIEYDTRTHHTSMDTYERIQSKDMMQNAVIVASLVYQAANSPEMFPRKALPAPPPPRGGGRGGQ